MPQPADAPPAQPHCLARALYDNVPDSPDELAFRRGDTLIVLEQNAGGIEGWWLCALRGRQGICPANRLRLIPGVYEDSSQSRVSSPQFADVPGDLSYLQRQGKRRSWHAHPNQVVTPRRVNDVYLYDMPPSRCPPAPCGGGGGGATSPADCYDVPRRAVPVGGCPRCPPATPPSADTYDVPRSLHQQPSAGGGGGSCSGSGTLTPSSSASSLTAESVNSSNRSSLANMPDYDVPRPHPRAVQPPPPHLPTPSHPKRPPPPPHHSQTYDVPVPRLAKELPLELGSALENLERLQTDSTSAISKLLSFVAPQWRSRERLENTLMDIKLSATRLRTSLHDLADFGEGALGNAGRASDRNLARKLAPLVAAIRKSDALVQEAARELNRHGWSLDVLTRRDHEDSPTTSIPSSMHKPDELDQLVACARALTEDIRQIASFIQGNGTLLFKRESPPPALVECPEEYDYVSLDSKENVSRSHTQILDDLPGELKKGYDNCVRRADDVAFDADQKLAADDRQVLQFFAVQTITHHANLTQAIDAFLQTVEHNQPPKIFLAHGKFVVLSAHKLVHIGDTVHRNIECKEVREKALKCANALSDALAASVAKTKQAALLFPSVTAVQEMVDSVVDISHSARDLKVCLVRAAVPA